MAYNLQNWQSTFANPTSNVNRGILGPAFNTNPLTARGMNILGSNIAYGLPFAYASLANRLQQNLPQSLQGQDGLADQNPYYGAMGVAVNPEVEETLRYGDAVTGTNYPGANRLQRYPGSAYSPHRGFEEMQFDETVQTPDEGIWSAAKRKGKQFMTPVMALLRAMGGERPEAKQKFYDEIMQGRSLEPYQTGMYKGNEYGLYNSPSGLKVSSDILGWGQGFEKNLDSWRGSKSIEEMEQKKVDWALGRLDKFKDDEENLGISKRLFNALINRGVIDSSGKRITTPAGADTTTGPFNYITKKTTTGGTTGRVPYTGPKTYDFDRGAFQRSGGRRADKPGGFTDPGKGSYGPHKASGGRVGYRTAGPVLGEDEDSENIFEFMQDQNIPYGEMASAEGMPFMWEEFLAAKELDPGLTYKDFLDAIDRSPWDETSIQDQGLASLV